HRHAAGDDDQHGGLAADIEKVAGGEELRLDHREHQADDDERRKRRPAERIALDQDRTERQSPALAFLDGGAAHAATAVMARSRFSLFISAFSISATEAPSRMTTTRSASP